MNSINKNKKISECRKATKLRRENLVCKTYSCKIDKSHLSKRSIEFLRMCFLEAKWFVNDILSSDSIFNSNYKKRIVTVLKDGNNPEQRQISHLSSQIRQSLADKLKQDIFNLTKMKEKGIKVGKLKFKKEIKCLPLKQNRITFRIIDSHYIQLQGNKKSIKIDGLDQIPINSEIAKADLIHKAGNYYLKITCFIPKEIRIKTGKSIGLDFGIETNVTTSDGDKFNICIPEPIRLRKLQRGKSSRKVKHSKNWTKKSELIAIEYEKMNNRRKDLKDKLVHKLTKEYDVICCQDENVKGWHQGWFGRQVQHSCMGGIISDLKRKSETFIQVNKWYPSTQICHICGNRQEVKLKDRIFICSACDVKEDRDTHSAINILKEGLKSLPERVMGNPEHVKSPVELLTPTNLDTLLDSKLVVMNQEATRFSWW